MNDHYFKDLRDGLLYIFISYLIPICMAIFGMKFNIEDTFYLIFSTIMVTLPLIKDYSSGFTDTYNGWLLVSAILLGVQCIFCAVLGTVHFECDSKSTVRTFSVVYFISSIIIYLFPLVFFIKDTYLLYKENKEKKEKENNPKDSESLLKNDMATKITK